MFDIIIERFNRIVCQNVYNKLNEFLLDDASYAS